LKFPDRDLLFVPFLQNPFPVMVYTASGLVPVKPQPKEAAAPRQRYTNTMEQLAAECTAAGWWVFTCS